MRKYITLLAAKFNRLFWKVFLALWISSLAVMLVTVLVIGEIADKDNIKSKVTFKVRLHIEQFIARYESNERFKDRVIKHTPNFRKSITTHGRMFRDGLPKITLHNELGEQILGGKKIPTGEKVSLTVISQLGKTYHVAYYLKASHSSIKRWQTFVFSVQALLILLSSTLASLIVSSIVVRPMNELTQHVQRLKSGELSVRVVDKLSERGDEIGDFAREFNQMAEYVENTLKGQQQLFQNVSHELRAPLARLLAASGIIEQQVGLQNPAVNRIQLECERLSVLIEELLALAKLQQQQQANRSLDVQPLIKKMVADHQFSQPDRLIRFGVTSRANCQAQGSAGLLERAVGNILGNSLKHTDQQTEITVRLSNPDKNTLQIRIEDNGPGVPEAALGNLCEPFIRLDTNIPGHGLGLGIARQAMQIQEGSLSIENVKPRGLRVDLQLNLTAYK